MKTTNHNPHPSAAPVYHLAVVNGEAILLTPNELKIALDRAKKNPEDCSRAYLLRPLNWFFAGVILANALAILVMFVS